MAHKIAAVATGWARTGIGVLRLSGDGCIEAADRVFRSHSGKPLTALPDRKLTLGTLFDRRGRAIDECMAFVSRAPHSYTGEDSAEIQCHGSPAMLAEALESLFAVGFAQAKPGEFTRRAFVNGRMDLTQAEAVIDLIDAETADAAANAAGQVAGVMRARLQPIYDGLVELCAHFHAVLDYPDEDIDPFELAQFEGLLQDDVRTLSGLLASCERGRLVKSGVRAAILGAPNAGKSSLLNLLAGFARVIVTDIPGTTRDCVEQSVKLGRHLVRLLDTAGIRETQDVIERMGVDRSKEAARACDVALLVIDASKPLSDEDRAAMEAAEDAPETVVILNKQDLGCVVSPAELPFGYIVPMSAGQGEGAELLESALDMIFDGDTPCDGSLLTNTRQADAAGRARDALEAALSSMRAGVTPDAVLTDVEAAMLAIGELTGAVMREDITTRIFERFCVGK